MRLRIVYRARVTDLDPTEVSIAMPSLAEQVIEFHPPSGYLGGEFWSSYPMPDMQGVGHHFTQRGFSYHDGAEQLYVAGSEIVRIYLLEQEDATPGAVALERRRQAPRLLPGVRTKVLRDEVEPEAEQPLKEGCCQEIDHAHA